MQRKPFSFDNQLPGFTGNKRFPAAAFKACDFDTMRFPRTRRLQGTGKSRNISGREHGKTLQLPSKCRIARMCVWLAVFLGVQFLLFLAWQFNFSKSQVSGAFSNPVARFSVRAPAWVCFRVRLHCTGCFQGRREPD